MGRRRPPALGQHFLHDPAIAGRIVDALSPEGRSVLEIGPGKGILTRLLAGRSERLTAVEIDRRLAEDLRQDPRLADVAIVEGDILSRPLQQWQDPPPGGPFLLIGNLPYQITSPLLFACLDSREFIDRAVLMMQREVAARLSAREGSRTYGSISVLAALIARAEIVLTVGKGAFKPPPRVESAVVRLTMLEQPLGGIGEPGGLSHEWVKKVVKAAFSQRRKMLRNSLKGGLTLLDPEEIAEGAAAAGIDLDRRAETLSPEEFIELARALPEQNGV
ncbi:16S rRNA (adenine(1518)-N(6)/adenine(1519)-N(6))-dimethyltransferase RsmA [Gemmatimonadota bacterium]